MSLLRLEGISVVFGGLQALDDLSFDVEAGEVFTIIGPNGAGKSTIFNVVSRIYNASRGEVYFRDQLISDMAPDKIAHLGVARTFQNIELFEQTTVLQNLLVGRHSQRGRSGFLPLPTLLAEILFLPSVRQEERRHRLAVEEIIEFLDLQPYRDHPISSLPYGIRKMVELGRALAAAPKLLLLDEPASGLSAEETDVLAFRLEDIQKEMGITLLIIEHDMNLVSLVSDRVLVLDQGKCLAIGDVATIQSNEQVIEAYLGSVSHDRAVQDNA